MVTARAGMTVSESVPCVEWPRVSRTSAVKEKVPAVEGVPESSPVAERLRPAGSAPSSLLQE